jgi:hypothetical protein
MIQYLVSWRFDGTIWVRHGKGTIECELWNEHQYSASWSSKGQQQLPAETTIMLNASLQPGG